MNVQHRTSNIERRIMMSLRYLTYFKIEERKHDFLYKDKKAQRMKDNRDEKNLSCWC
jgi:hypothetical protein